MSERAVKSYVMGRKNFLFQTQNNQVYTLAKVNGLSSALYLETVITKMLDYKNESKSILEDLMLWSEMMYET